MIFWITNNCQFCNTVKKDLSYPEFDIPITPEGVCLVEEWARHPYPNDKAISGVLADWLEENESVLVDLGADALRIRAVRVLVVNLRLRCNSFALGWWDVEQRVPAEPPTAVPSIPPEYYFRTYE